MKHVFSFGGGGTSLLGALACVEQYGRDNVDVVMAALEDDERDPERLDLEFTKITGKPVTRVTIKSVSKSSAMSVQDTRVLGSGEPAPYGVWDVFFYTGVMGNTQFDPCSRVLKRETLKHYLLNSYNPSETVLHVGITHDEIDRMLAITRNWRKSGFKVNAPLAEDDSISRETINDKLVELIGWVPALYREGRLHKNCGGACVKAGQSEWARFLWFRSSEFARWERLELTHQRVFNHKNTILRDQTYKYKRVKVNGLWQRQKVYITTPLTLREFRNRMQSQWQDMLPGFDPFIGLQSMPACTFCESIA